jgi:hypothetical protein
MRPVTFAFSVVVSALSMGAMGCGGGKAMPSADQKNALQFVEAAELRAESAITVPSLIGGGVSQGHVTAKDGGPNPNDDARVEMMDQIQKAVDSGACKVTKTGLDGATTGQVNPMDGMSGTLSVNGDQCPIDFELNLSTQKSGEQNVAIVFGVSYTVKDDTYRKLNDVDSLSISLNFKITASDTSGDISGSMSLKTHSQKYGDISEIANLTGQVGTEGGSATLTDTVTFPGFDIQRTLQATKSASGDESYDYSVNGNSDTKDDFYSYGDVLIASGPAS